MAEQLIDGMTTDWDPSKYKDRFYGDVMKIIEEKAKHGKIKARKEETQGEVATDVVDLLALLKKSVAGGSGHRKAANTNAKKTRTRRKKAA